MSAPQTNIEKQTRRHRGPLRGMFAVVLFALTMLVILGFWAFGRGGSPEGAAVQVQSGAGAEVQNSDGTVSANTDANDDGDGAAAVAPGADPTAVDVPSLQAEHPQSGQSQPVNPLVAPSENAVPVEPVPVEEGGEGVVTD